MLLFQIFTIYLIGMVFLKTSAYDYDDTSFCCNKQQVPMFTINKFDYLEPIKRLKEYYKGSVPNYYDKLLAVIKPFNYPLETAEHNYMTDEVILQYVKCFSTMRMITLWPSNGIKNITQLKGTPFYKKLVNNGSIHVIKQLTLSTKQLQGVIYQLFYNNSDFKKFEVIKDKQSKCCNKSSNTLFVVFFEPNFHEVETLPKKDINFLHRELEYELGETLRKNQAIKRLQFTTVDDYIHMTKNFNETIDGAKLLCNKNSIRLLDYQRLDLITYRDFRGCTKKLMTFKNWLYNEIEQIDQLRFMIFSSAVLYALGVRNCNDLDLIVHNKPSDDTVATGQFFDKINYYFEDDRTKFDFVDIHIEGRGQWIIGGEKERLYQWFNKEWPELYGAESMHDTVLNPEHHFYYFGLKIISMKADIKRRLKRERPAAFADLIALNKLTNAGIKFEKLTKGYWKNAQYFEFTSAEIKELYKKIIWYLKTRYMIHMTVEEVMHLIG